jgi:hypothetical protein
MPSTIPNKKELLEAMAQGALIMPLPARTMDILNSQIVVGDTVHIDYAITLDGQTMNGYLLHFGCIGDAPPISYADLLTRLVTQYTLTRLDGGGSL